MSIIKSFYFLKQIDQLFKKYSLIYTSLIVQENYYNLFENETTIGICDILKENTENKLVKTD